MSGRRRSRTALCLADLHSNVTALRRLDALLAVQAGALSVVLIAGDVTIPGHEAYGQDVVDVVGRHGVPLLLVHGNNDTLAAVEAFRRAGVTIHRREREVDGVRFVGFGGDGTATHDVELGPDETLDLNLAGSILLTHLPPHGLRYTADDGAAGPPRPRAGGATPGPRRPDPELPAPRAHICGHIHGTEGVAWVATTKVIKLRAAMWNRCAYLDLDTLRADFRDLSAPGPFQARERGEA